MTRIINNKEKCNGRYLGCITDIEERFPVIYKRFFLQGGAESKKFKPVIQNGKCLSYEPNEKLIKALENENTRKFNNET